MSIPYQDMEANYAEGSDVPQERVNKYETALPIRLDIEAALTYLLGCITGIFFLMFEYKCDYVRFHAWQSCLIFTPLLLLHLIFMLIGGIGVVFNWLLFIVDILLVLFLGWEAYKNSESLDRYKVPYLGDLASRWTDTE